MISPDQAQDVLDEMQWSSREYTEEDVTTWLETIAAMTVEEDWRLVNPDHNGGRYEKKRWTRMVSEWVPDE